MRVLAFKTCSFMIACLIASTVLGVSIVVAEETEALARVRELRLAGALAEAMQLAERELAATSDDPRREITLNLELARIHDRIGLHQNTRPVAKALEHIDAAVDIARDAGWLPMADIELARADYYYRAEIIERKKHGAKDYAHRAIKLYKEAGNDHGHADAVHKLGLIHLQNRDLDRARTLFDHSLELDRAGGERAFFRGEYERHVGLVYLFSDSAALAIPYLERSLRFRREAGAIDASLFAGSMLASALVDLGRLDEARPHIEYALSVADDLNSPVGTARVYWVLGRLHRSEGDMDSARTMFEMTVETARSVGYKSIADRAQKALEQLP